MKTRPLFSLRFCLFALFIVAAVSAPFVIWGDSFVAPLLAVQGQRTVSLVVIAIILLAADSVAPVPATFVIMVLAAKAGMVAGVIGGTLGLAAGVLASGWIGRFAVGRIAPTIFPDAELGRLRAALEKNVVVTLACWRSVPVMAETSVILAAAAGVPVRRLFWVTLAPNFAIAVIYSVTASDSLVAASGAFAATLLVSLVGWKWWTKAPKGPTENGR